MHTTTHRRILAIVYVRSLIRQGRIGAACDAAIRAVRNA